uniref:Leucine-rich repeat-containing protein 29 n=1 Tax=Heterorhabditis bacteriophora TaxID=37862 RepID=A0A1I7WWE4_HETBA
MDNSDRLSAVDCDRLVSSPSFGANLTQLRFYLSDDLTDSILSSLTETNKRLEKITLVECSKVTDKGVRLLTRGQTSLVQLELRAMNQLSDEGLTDIFSSYLHTVDLSGCGKGI